MTQGNQGGRSKFAIAVMSGALFGPLLTSIAVGGTSAVSMLTTRDVESQLSTVTGEAAHIASSAPSVSAAAAAPAVSASASAPVESAEPSAPVVSAVPSISVATSESSLPTPPGDAQQLTSSRAVKRMSQAAIVISSAQRVAPVIGGSAAADEVGMSDRSAKDGFMRRPYVVLGGGFTKLNPKSPTSALRVGDDEDTGFHVAVGYDLHRMLSAEVHVANLGSAGIDFLGERVGEVDYQVYGVTGLLWLLNSRDGLVPLSSSKSGAHRREGLSLYLKGGIGGMTNDSNIEYRRDYDLHAAFGVGLEYGFSNGFAVRSEYMGFDNDAQYLSLNLIKRFGRLPATYPVDPGVRSLPPTPVDVPADVPTETEAETPVSMPLEPLLVFFAFDHSDIDQDSRVRLDDFIVTVKDQPFTLYLSGHTDWVGSDEYNLNLSRRRAEEVRQYLIDQGIGSERISTEAFGESRPIDTNETPEGRARNRRTEIELQR